MLQDRRHHVHLLGERKGIFYCHYLVVAKSSFDEEDESEVPSSFTNKQVLQINTTLNIFLIDYFVDKEEKPWSPCAQAITQTY